MPSDLKVSFFLAIRSLSRGSRGSLVLSIVIMAMVFTNMLFLPSIVNGAVKNAEYTIIAYATGDILISPKTDDPYIYEVSSLTDRVNRLPGVVRTLAEYDKGATLRNKGKTLGRSVTAVHAEDARIVTPFQDHMKEGDFISDGETGQIVLGAFVSGHKDESEDMMPSLGGVRVGDSVTVEYTNGVVRNYRVKGIFETNSYEADTLVFVSWEEMESVEGHRVDEASAVLVKVAPGTSPDDVKREILRNGVQERVRTWNELIEKAMGQAVQSWMILSGITTIVSLIIAVVVLFIVIMIKTLHSKRQIGILKAIGLDKTIIINNYLFQVLILALLGTIVGVIVTESLVLYLTIFPLKFPGGDIIPVVGLGDLASNALLLVAASAVAGYVPGWMVAKEEILEAMRGQP